MSIENKKEKLSEAIADYILHYGLQSATLRKIATVTAVSDRMLMHYYKDKDELLASALSVLERRLEKMLNSSVTERLSFIDLVLYLDEMQNREEVWPYLRTALDLIADQENSHSKEVAKHIFSQFFDWICSMLEEKAGADHRKTASLVFTIIEGSLLLKCAGMDDVVKDTLQCIRNFTPSQRVQ